MDSSNSFVLVTGALGGIGAAIVFKLLKNGHKVVATDIRVPTNNQDGNIFVQMDLQRFVTDSIYASSKNDEIYKAANGGKCSGIVSNAAEQLIKPIKDFSVKDILDVITVNSLATLSLTQCFWDDLSAINGKVISIGSVHDMLSKPTFGGYAISKATLSAVTRAISLESEGKFTTLTISPGAIETNMLLEGFKEFPEKYNDLINILPTRRLGAPSDVADLVSFIMETKSNYLNGSEIRIDGGISGRLHDPL